MNSIVPSHNPACAYNYIHIQDCISLLRCAYCNLNRAFLHRNRKKACRERPGAQVSLNTSWGRQRYMKLYELPLRQKMQGAWNRFTSTGSPAKKDLGSRAAGSWKKGIYAFSPAKFPNRSGNVA